MSAFGTERLRCDWKQQISMNLMMFTRLTHSTCTIYLVNHNRHHKLMNNMFDTWFLVYLSALPTFIHNSLDYALLWQTERENCIYESQVHVRFNCFFSLLQLIILWASAFVTNPFEFLCIISSAIGVIQLNIVLYTHLNRMALSWADDMSSRSKINPS